MRKVLIIAPHFPPSNLASVHRSRLFAQHLPEFGWEPVILAVDEQFYEEQLDWNLVKLLPAGLRIEKVKAYTIKKTRVIGDIGLRAFLQLYKKAKALIKNEKIDFLYIPIPSFYIALLGRLLHASTGVKYGIDYIDPWINAGKGDEKLFSRFGLSLALAKWLEPVAIKKASLITGVAEGYYKGVQERNPAILNTSLFGAMPYGGEAKDHEMVKQIDSATCLFEQDKNKIQLVYAGAMLPQAYKPLEAIFKSIKENISQFENVEFYFIGTGTKTNDPEGYNIKPLAEQYGLWQKIIFEFPKRIPYLDVLVHLNIADGVFVLGSTEPHYTPSKVYQGVLSGKPLLAVLHQDSTAVNVINDTGAGIVLPFNGENGIDTIQQYFANTFKKYRSFIQNFKKEQVDMSVFEQYSAKNITKTLTALFDKAIQNQIKADA